MAQLVNDRRAAAPDALAPDCAPTAVTNHGAAYSCCGPRALFGWSPPTLPADTTLKRWVDAIMPSTGLPLVAFYTAVAILLNVGLLLPKRLDLLSIGVASLAAGSWCAVNFWRCRHAHCLITGPSWLALAGFALVEAGLGRSLMRGDEALAFLGILAAGLAFECVWFCATGTHAIGPRFRGTAG
jgi:hypothetical protein